MDASGGRQRIDFRGLEPGGERWVAVRAQVMAALQDCGCVVAAYAVASPELQRQLFVAAEEELFSLALETKRRNASDVPFMGYVGQIPGMAYESLRITGAADADDPAGVDRFVSLMWPDAGNPTFRDAAWGFAKEMRKLQEMVERMVLESIGCAGEDAVAGHLAGRSHSLRLWDYGPPVDQETKISLAPHFDPSTLTVIYQHEVEGLEVQSKDGEWIPVPPAPDTFAVIAGEFMRIVSNGRVKPCWHRVRTPSSRRRFSAVLGVLPREGILIRTPEEAVDEQHPKLFNACNAQEYIKFKYSEEGIKSEDQLMAFCGISMANKEVDSV